MIAKNAGPWPETISVATSMRITVSFSPAAMDLIVNASPSHLHVPITLECLQHRFNVLCEKPLARYSRDVDHLMTAADLACKVLAVYQQSRYNPAFRQVRKIIESGVGRIVQARINYSGFALRWDWQTLKSMTGGNLLQRLFPIRWTKRCSCSYRGTCPGSPT
jgi:predicted dehydrogenase